MQAPPKQTYQLVKLEQAARDVSMGQISIEAYTAVLDAMEAVCQEQLRSVQGVAIPEQLAAEMRDEMAAGVHGIRLYLEALGELRAYVTERRLDALQSGVEKARLANDLVNEAMRLNWESYQIHRQATEEYLSQMGVNPGGQAENP